MRASPAIAVLAVLACLAALAGAGCGGSSREESTPVACLAGPSAYLKALRAAPNEVRVGGDASISECLTENQDAGELATVGEAMVKAATTLNAEARAEPGGGANLQLGYLLGAAQKGSEGSEGIHTDLIRRLTVAARFAPGTDPLPQAFLDAYRRGFDAGHAHG